MRHQRGDARRGDAGKDSITAEGRAELAAAMQEGLGDHILMLRLYQVAAVIALSHFVCSCFMSSCSGHGLPERITEEFGGALC